MAESDASVQVLQAAAYFPLVGATGIFGTHSADLAITEFGACRCMASVQVPSSSICPL